MYDRLRRKSDSLSSYTNVAQSADIRKQPASNRLYTLLCAVAHRSVWFFGLKHEEHPRLYGMSIVPKATQGVGFETFIILYSGVLARND